jgi:hypothetical protein
MIIVVDDNIPLVVDDDSITSEDEERPTNNKRTCCICGVTSSTDPPATFSSIPYPKRQTMSMAVKDNKVRKRFYQRIHRRTETLQRLFGDDMNKKRNKRKHLRFCNRHPIEMATIEYKWMDSDQHEMRATEDMIVPVDPNDPPNRTRLQQLIRKEPPIKTININEKNKITKRSVSRKVCNYQN